MDSYQWANLAVIVGCTLLLTAIFLFRSKVFDFEIVSVRAVRRRRVWKLLSDLGGVTSNIIDSNPRVKHVLQPAFRGALHELELSSPRTYRPTECQIISTPHNEWVAAYVRSDLVDKPNDGKPEIFKAEATAFVFARRLNGISPEVSFVNKSYRRRSFLYMPAWKIAQSELTYCEGVFTESFDMYARLEEQIEALAFAGPDLLEVIRDCADASDIYFLGNYVYFLMPVRKANATNIARIFESSKKLVDEANTNLPRTKNSK